MRSYFCAVASFRAIATQPDESKRWFTRLLLCDHLLLFRDVKLCKTLEPLFSTQICTKLDDTVICCVSLPKAFSWWPDVVAAAAVHPGHVCSFISTTLPLHSRVGIWFAMFPFQVWTAQFTLYLCWMSSIVLWNKQEHQNLTKHRLVAFLSFPFPAGSWVFGPGCLYVSVFSAALPQNPDNHARLEAPQVDLTYHRYQRLIHKLFFILSVLKYVASQHSTLIIFEWKLARITHRPAFTEPGRMTDQYDWITYFFSVVNLSTQCLWKQSLQIPLVASLWPVGCLSLASCP